MWVTGQITLTGSYNCNNNLTKSKVKRFAQFFSCWSVINTLTFLMNDFRFKSLYRATNTTTTTNTSTLNKTILTTTPTTTFEDSIKKSKKSRRGGSNNNKTKKSSTAFDNSNNNNPRTYNNSSKSNKVFLHYIPRDPRLRIFNRTATLNKHLAHPRRTLSELNITEDLCNYGELIGG
ncbi:hypothetical protein KR044_011517, partial [Drosophila immigrans]